jgi:hypothetical protein
MINKLNSIYGVYPLTLIRCRNGNWLHVSSMLTTPTINLTDK